MVNFQMVLTKINDKANDDSSHLGCDATSTGSSNPLTAPILLEKLQSHRINTDAQQPQLLY
jgi:hypothetical protein